MTARRFVMPRPTEVRGEFVHRIADDPQDYIPLAPPAPAQTRLP